MTSAFTGILEGQEPCFKVLENDEFIAILSQNPVREGHTLVLPRQETDSWYDLPDDKLGRLMAFAKKTALLIRKAVACTKVGMMTAGIQVRHVHLHLVPIDQPSDLDFSKAKPASAETLKDLAGRMTSLEGLRG